MPDRQFIQAIAEKSRLIELQIENNSIYHEQLDEGDLVAVLGDMCVNVSEINQAGRYIALPINQGQITQKIVEVVKHCQGYREQLVGEEDAREHVSLQFDHEKIAGEVEIIIPVCTGAHGGHWRLYTVKVKDGKLKGIECSDSMPGNDQHYNFNNDPELLNQFIGQNFAGVLQLEDFTIDFKYDAIYRSEQTNGWSCLDHTVAHILRKLGKTLSFRGDDEGDCLSLSYFMGRANLSHYLRDCISRVINARYGDIQARREIILRDLTDAEIARLEIEKEEVKIRQNRLARQVPLEFHAQSEDNEQVVSSDLDDLSSFGSFTDDDDITLTYFFVEGFKLFFDFILYITGISWLIGKVKSLFNNKVSDENKDEMSARSVSDKLSVASNKTDDVASVVSDVSMSSKLSNLSLAMLYDASSTKSSLGALSSVSAHSAPTAVSDNDEDDSKISVRSRKTR